MELYVVQPGDTLYGIAQSMGVPMSRLLADNRPPDPARLVEGQALVVRFPEEVYAVREGDTVTLYISDTAPLYEWQGIHRLHAYLAMVPGKRGGV